MNGTTYTLSKVQEIALVGILAAVNIASRVVLVSLPNIKPVTSIIIISVLIFGLRFGVELTVVTTVVSNLYLGMGIWTFFQILAWIVVCLLTDGVKGIFLKLHKEPPLLFMAVFAFFMGYVFGFFVSLDKFLMGGIALFLPYYISGLFFDTLHACGNFGFYLVCAPVLMKVFRNYYKLNHS